MIVRWRIVTACKEQMSHLMWCECVTFWIFQMIMYPPNQAYLHQRMTYSTSTSSRLKMEKRRGRHLRPTLFTQESILAHPKFNRCKIAKFWRLSYLMQRFHYNKNIAGDQISKYADFCVWHILRKKFSCCCVNTRAPCPEYLLIYCGNISEFWGVLRDSLCI
jgi:hypothetical protein